MFLFGAGASYGSGPCFPCPPPLGSQLFPALQAAGGVAATIDEDLSKAFNDFEVGMDRFWLEKNTHTPAFLREMACFFAPFEPLPGNSYLKLIKLLGGTRKKAVMVTTNYDLMIEHAISKSGCLVSYRGFPVPEQNVPVLKIHGSCNFLPNVPLGNIKGLVCDLSKTPEMSIMDVDIRPAFNAQEIIDFCKSEDSYAPALAMYSPSKHVLYGKKYVEAQKNYWLEELSRVSRIYVIGLRVHLVDKHIWEPLAKSKVPIHYVGLEPDEFTEWAKNNNRQSSFVLANSFEDALPKIALHLDYRGTL